MDGKELQEIIAEQLRKAGFEFQREPRIGGIRPDFLVKGPKGQLVIVEARAWSPGGGNTARAWRQVKLYESFTDATSAVFVIPESKYNYTNKGVVNADGLVSHLTNLFAEKPPRKTRIKPQSPGKLVFAAMPFASKYDDTYLVAMAEAAKNNNASCERVDHNEFTGDSVEKMKRLIEQCHAVIADLSESKPNVLFEAGYAAARGLPIVYICSTEFDAVPFNVRNEYIISYDKGQTKKLIPKLSNRLKPILK